MAARTQSFAATHELLLQATGGLRAYQWLVFLWYQCSFCVIVGNLEIFAINKSINNQTNASQSIVATFEFDRRDPSLAAALTCGIIFGLLFAGYLADTYGRRRTFTPFLLTLSIFGFSNAFSSNWLALISLRALTGVGLGGVVATQFVLLEEALPKDRRLHPFVGGWPFSMVICGSLAYFVRDWRLTTCALNGFAIVPLLLTMFVVEESPKWLLEKRRFSEALAVFERIAKWNSTSGDLNAILNRIIPSDEPTYRTCFSPLFRSKETTIQLVTIVLLFIVTNTIFNMSAEFVGRIVPDAALNLAVSGAVRTIMKIIVVVIDFRVAAVGRRALLFVGLTSCIATVSSAAIISLLDDNRTDSGHLALAILGTIFASPVWVAVRLYSVELFPTASRAIGGSFCNVGGRLGRAIAFEVPALRHLWPAAHFILLFAMVVPLFVASYFYMPERKGEPLTDLSDEPAVRTKAQLCFGEDDYKLSAGAPIYTVVGSHIVPLFPNDA